MRKTVIWVVVAIIVCVAGFFGVRESMPLLARLMDPAASPELSKPPDLLTGKERGEKRLLFDAKTTNGWKIKGPNKVEQGTLELGGSETCEAVLETVFEAGDEMQFHFFQEGTAGVKLTIQSILIDPKDTMAESRRDVNLDPQSVRTCISTLVRSQGSVSSLE